MCQAHGGGAPQVRRSAAMRILALVDPALANLANDLKSKERTIRQRATFDVLDRAGLKAADKLILEDAANPTGVDRDLSLLTDEELAQARALALKAQKITA